MDPRDFGWSGDRLGNRAWGWSCHRQPAYANIDTEGNGDAARDLDRHAHLDQSAAATCAHCLYADG